MTLLACLGGGGERTHIIHLPFSLLWRGCLDSGFIFLVLFHFPACSRIRALVLCASRWLEFGAGEIVPHMPVWGNVITLGRLVTAAVQSLNQNM